MLALDLIHRLYLRLTSLRQRQRTRRQLLQLDAQALKDLGLTRADAVREGSKMFWQA